MVTKSKTHSLFIVFSLFVSFDQVKACSNPFPKAMAALKNFYHTPTSYRPSPSLSPSEQTLKCLDITQDIWDEASLIEQKIRKIVHEDRCRFPRCLVTVPKLSMDATDRIMNELQSIKKPDVMFAVKSMLGRSYDFNIMELVYGMVDPKKQKALVDAFGSPFLDITKDQKRTMVISDVDDTILPSLHDTHMVKNSILQQIGTLFKYQKRLNPYPGVMELYDILSCNGENLTLLSARPNVIPFFKHLTHSTFNALAHPGEHPKLGKRTAQPLLVFNRKMSLKPARMAQGKIDNMSLLIELFPEYKYIFFGDSGEGDYTFAEKHHENLEMAFIHDIKVNNPLLKDVQHKSDNIFFIKNYYDAAYHLKNKKYISKKQFKKMFKHPYNKPSKWEIKTLL